ncbi:MAG: RNA polymerase sigma factor [Phycisphaeraceae bacterium]|nr:RNA polymerase sigma factor [Phycisphaeraceae bacterium]
MPEPSPTRRAIEAVWKIEAPRLIAGLVRRVRDVGLAEEAAQDAFVEALEQWPDAGVPENPGAWLATTARRRAIDRIRREQKLREIGEALSRESGTSDPMPAAIDRLDDPIEDDLLRLVFMTSHPLLPDDARSALTLRLLCGLSTGEIARAFLVPEPTIAQRIVRAKRTLSDNRVAFEVPVGKDLPERLASVLEVLYLLFNEGYTATAGDDWIRPSLCEESMRLGRILEGLMPLEPEVHGLVALMELQASRLNARTDRDGNPILLPDQDRSRWDRTLIRHGLGALDAARRSKHAPGPYTLQAEIAACHARANSAAGTDWRQIADLYGRLGLVAPSPIVELNRAVAVGMAEGPQAGLRIVDALTTEPALAAYHLLPAVRADFLFKLSRFAEAAPEFERAATMTRNTREQSLLRERAAECKRSAGQES